MLVALVLGAVAAGTLLLSRSVRTGAASSQAAFCTEIRAAARRRPPQVGAARFQDLRAAVCQTEQEPTVIADPL